MGLRLTEGIDLSRIAQKTGVAATELLDRSAIEGIIKLGLIRRYGDHVTVTPQGMPLLDAILREIVAVEALATA